MVTERTDTMPYKTGDMIELDGLLGSVVGLPDGGNVPEDHLAVWFGEPKCDRISAGGKGRRHPEIWIVPDEYCQHAEAPAYKH